MEGMIWADGNPRGVPLWSDPEQRRRQCGRGGRGDPSRSPAGNAPNARKRF